MVRIDWRMLCLVCLVFGPGLALGQTGAGEVVKGGIPENMPGLHVLPDGTLLVSDPVQKKIKTCFEERLKRRVVWSAVPTARLLNQVQANELDFAYPMQIKPERNALMQPSEYTWHVDILQIARRKVDMADKNIRVGVRLNSPEYADMKEAGYANVSAPSDYDALNKMLAQDFIDVALLPDTLYKELAKGWMTGLVVTVRNSRYVGFYLNKADPHKLLEPVNQAAKACRPR